MSVITSLVAANSNALRSLDGMGHVQAAGTVAWSIEGLGASVAQIDALARDIANAITGASADIHHEIEAHVVNVETDDDELTVLVDGRAIATYDLSRVAIAFAA